MRLLHTLLLLIFSLVVYSKSNLKIFVEEGEIDDKLLFSLHKELYENFQVNLEMIKIELDDKTHLINSIIDGTIFPNHKIVKDEGVYYLFLTSKVLSIENTLFELRGLASDKHSVAIISTHKIKEESIRLQLTFELQFFKAVKHEFLHLLGLEHCDGKSKCIMVASFPPSNFHFSFDCLCNLCLRKIDSSLIKPKLRCLK